MLFAFICFDNPGMAELRQRIWAEHIEYMIAVKDRTVFGGPLKDDEGETTIGSIFAIDFEDRSAADKFIAGEPYTREGVFETPRIYRWGQMVPEVVEGALEQELERQRAMAAAS